DRSTSRNSMCSNFCHVLKESKKLGLAYIVKRPQKVGQVKHYPVIERVRYCAGLFPFNRDLILLYYCPLNFKDSKNVWLER
ncbi:MAG: hypothetical protein ACI4US_03080, partial [Muribaculaceae bacterium]